MGEDALEVVCAKLTRIARAFTEGISIVVREGHVDNPRQDADERLAVEGLRRRRERAADLSVEATLEGDDGVASGMQAGRLESGLDRFAAGGHDVDDAERIGGKACELF